MSENFGAVVVELSRAGFIRTALVSVNKEKMSDQLFQQMPIPGNEISRSLESYLCKLNRHVCSPITKDRFKWTMQVAKTPIAEPTPCPADLADKSRSADQVCIPILKVSTYSTSIKIPFNGQVESLAKKVVDLNACPDFGKECVTSIMRLNPGLTEGATKNGSIIGTIRFPTTAFRLRVYASDSDAANRISEMIRTLARTREAAGDFDRLNPNIFVTPGTREAEPAQPKVEAIAADGSISPIDMRHQALHAMNYQWAAGDLLSSLRNYFQVTVGVWDISFDPKHCEFGKPLVKDGPGGQILRYDPLPTYASATVDDRAQCGVIGQASLDDHGTYVAGVIAGVGFGELGLGVNPRARLWVYELAADKLAQDLDPINAAWLGDNDGQRVAPARVINFSNTSPQVDYHKLLQTILIGDTNFSPPRITWSDRVLFVAAAGEDGTGYASEAGCDIYPACWSSDKYGGSIISVIALNGTGDALVECPLPNGQTSKTNFGTAFDVAAVGVGFSSLRDNKFGEMCGTSVAAPYVSGLASLLLAKADDKPGVTPNVIKQRILATADMVDFLEGKVRFGRINFDRALHYEDDLLFVDTGVCATPPCGANLSGMVAKIGRTLSVNQAWENGVQRNNPLDLVRVLRITREIENDQRFRVAYLSDEGAMEILNDVAFQPNTKLVLYNNTATGSSIQQIDLERIVDFTPCSIACRVNR